jgi:hypothetical protein
MAMTEGEATAVEEELRAVVAEAGLQWVLDQVDEFVLEGKPEFKLFRGGRGDETEAYVRELTTKRGVPRSEPYTAAERVSLLLEALERITSQPLELEAEITALVMEDDALDDVAWVDELEREPRRSVLEAEERDRSARAAHEELHPVLVELIARTRE